MNTPQLIEAAKALTDVALWIAKNKSCPHDSCDGCAGVDAAALIDLEVRANSLAAAIEASTDNGLAEAAKAVIDDSLNDIPGWCGRRYSVDARLLNQMSNAIIEASSQGEWQEISSAPKSGRMIVWGSWNGLEPNFHCVNRHGDKFFCEESDVDATHWKPIGNPPTAQPDEQVNPAERGNGMVTESGDFVKPCRANEPDEQVCPTCGARAGEECRREAGNCVHPTTANPVPPPEGEVAAEDLPDTEPVAEIAHRLTAEQEAFRKQNPQWAWTLLDTIKFVLAANTPPDGHVAVYLPANLASSLSDTANDLRWEDRLAIAQACRTALEVE